MLIKADMDIQEVIRFFSSRGLEAGYLVPTETGLAKSIMDAHVPLASYFRRTDLHNYSLQSKGTAAKVMIKTWLVKEDQLVETKTSLYRPETKSGDPRLWIYELSKHVCSGNLLAIISHEHQIYVVNMSLKGLVESSKDPSSPFSHLLDLLAGAKNKPLDDRFSEWNLRLLRSFFSEASKGEEVFLRVDKDFLDQIGQDIGGDDGFLKAVRKGPSWSKQNASFTQTILELIRERKFSSSHYKDAGDFDLTYRYSKAPAYLPYLAALVRNDSENANSYYAGLKNDLKLRHDFGTNEMKLIESVWTDLENWTRKNEGRFGFFKFRRLGGYALIGVPRSQSILMPNDIERLAIIFVQAQINPGQELTEEYLTRILNEARATKGIFTAGFQKALGIVEFEQPIRAAIHSAYSDWDGTISKKGDVEVNNGTSIDLKFTDRIGISLAVIQDEPLKISPCWRLPAIADTGMFEVSFKDIKWAGQFAGMEGGTSAPSVGKETDFWKSIVLASNAALQIETQYFDSVDAEPQKLELTLSKHLLWILVPVIDNFTGEIELREGDLPGSGNAYILVPPCSKESLASYLDRQKPKHQFVFADGLPEDWSLVCLIECNTLTPEQRLLPDGAVNAHPNPRAIRFIGGRSIRRGYSRMYLPYDLPSIEFDAPEGSWIKVPNNIAIQEVNEKENSTLNNTYKIKPLRRFLISLSNSKGASYEFIAISNDGKTLGNAKLRVASLSGEIVDTDRPFSIDNLGKPIASSEGLSGAYLFGPVDGPPEELNGFSMQISDLNTSLERNITKLLGVRGMFLDALAQSGSFDYGVARDLLRRLIYSSGECDEPIFILLELRRLGHLEFSNTHKGHIARIHSVKPTLYSLPSTYKGQPVWGVAGTLRIANWETLAREINAWYLLHLNNETKVFKPWNLIIMDESKAFEVCSRIDFKFAHMPCIHIASWSASLATFRDETFHNTMESIGSASKSALRFNASRGLFTASPNGNTCELWKVKDLDTGMDNLYVLAAKGNYAFVRDSRWGVWLALDEFAKWANKLPNMYGVHPLPITYVSAEGTLWLPARLNLPCILERALVLCSSNTPEVFKTRKQFTENSYGRLFLSYEDKNQLVLSVNNVYADMADGKWLAYRHVPERVATVIAEKIGAVLDVI
jgi:hypothetical protein